MVFTRFSSELRRVSNSYNFISCLYNSSSVLGSLVSCLCGLRQPRRSAAKLTTCRNDSTPRCASRVPSSRPRAPARASISGTAGLDDLRWSYCSSFRIRTTSTCHIHRMCNLPLRYWGRREVLPPAQGKAVAPVVLASCSADRQLHLWMNWFCGRLLQLSLCSFSASFLLRASGDHRHLSLTPHIIAYFPFVAQEGYYNFFLPASNPCFYWLLLRSPVTTSEKMFCPISPRAVNFDASRTRTPFFLSLIKIIQ